MKKSIQIASMVSVLIWLTRAKSIDIPGMKLTDAIPVRWGMAKTIGTTLRRRKQKLSDIMSHAGPVFIKLAQWITTRPDLVDLETIEDLRTLQDRAPEHPFEYTEKVMRKEFGERYGDEIVVKGKEPLGSGSLAQVYRILYCGEDAVVKILHPHVRTQVLSDIKLIDGLLKIGSMHPKVKIFKKTFDLDEFYASILRQLDLRTEGENMMRMRENFSNIPTIHIPKQLYSSEELLVETYAKGEKLHSFSERDPMMGVRANMLTSWALRKMILQDNWIHSDLHQGNMLYWREGDEVQLSIIDFGLVGSLDDESCQLAKQFLRFLFIPNTSKEAELLLSFNKNPDAGGRLLPIVDSFVKNNSTELYEKLLLSSMDIRSVHRASQEQLLTLHRMQNRYVGSPKGVGELFSELASAGAKMDLFKMSTFMMLDGMESEFLKYVTSDYHHLLYTQGCLDFGERKGFYDAMRGTFTKKVATTLEWK